MKLLQEAYLSLETHKQRGFQKILLAQQVNDELAINIGQLQGLGLPDICIICKRQPLGMFKSGFDQWSSFHCVLGICPTSQAEVSAYIQSLIMNQEKDTFSKIFGSDVIIFKITYITYDIFSKILLVCQFEQPSEGLSQFKNYGIQQNKQCIQLTKSHWEGAHISGILRVLDANFKMPSIDQYKQSKNIIKSDCKIALKDVRSQIKQNLNLSFPPLNDIIFYLNWPLSIVFHYLHNTCQLDLLLEQFNNLDDNIIFRLIKSLIHYKMKNYNKSLLELIKLQESNNWFNLPKYIMANVFIKQTNYEKAFILLKDLIVECYENQTIWITLSKIFRKQKLFQISLLFINKAIALPLKQTAKQIWNEMSIVNYRLLTQNKNLQQPQQMDQIFKIVHPLAADKIESYVQLCGYPSIENLLVRPRLSNKRDQKHTIEMMSKHISRPEFKVNQQTYDTLMHNDFLDIESELSYILNEVIKIQHVVGYQKLKSYINQYFYTTAKVVQKQIDQIYDPSEFQIAFKNQRNLNLNVSQISNTNKSMCNPRLQDDIEDCDSDEEQPEFLKKQKVNKSFDFTNIGPRMYQTPQHNNKAAKSPLKFTSMKKKQQQIKKANTIIIENAFESVESERQNKQFITIVNRVNIQQNEMISQAPKSGQDVQPQKSFIYGLVSYLNYNLNQQEQVLMNEQLKRRKEQVNSSLQGMVETINRIQTELDQLFYLSQDSNKQQNNLQNLQLNSTNNQQPVNTSSQLFKSNLKKALQTKQHLGGQIELKDFYIVQPLNEEEQDKEKTYIAFIKAESMFLYKCARLAQRLKRNDLCFSILQRLNSRIISVQITALFFNIVKDNNKLLIRQIQKMLADFQDCGISQVGFVPLWLEMRIVKMTKQYGANQILALLSSSESDFTFYLIKKIILTTDNLI
ncbi:unnamed protein product (macronuclear) [Paramecium tetraurelia]|uniref:Uncharacterized protein n=1 Tax=Paramecium tetraurelia TaxID=5888 RepID=A0BI07_PARTE|nr:uncharacterized protein GSPATT00029210001 [Paramecium tetraurelia]CAK58174.1 unnamed protein product [Paramecium tetraurelia]|eukprot:XP_001425572.1 hypothetical protein (macronuclear) [Paramecium tetraurelia strain d4-2]